MSFEEIIQGSCRSIGLEEKTWEHLLSMMTFLKQTL